MTTTEVKQEEVEQVKYMSAARVRRYQDVLGLNKAINDLLIPLRRHIAELKVARNAISSGKHTVKVEKGKPQTVDLDDAARAEYTKTIDAAAKQVKDLLGNSCTQEEAWQKEIDVLATKKIRFAKDSVEFLTSVIDCWVEELVVHGMRKTTESKLKMVKPIHFFDNGVEKLSMFPLYGTLATFRQEYDLYMRKVRQDATAAEIKEAVRAAETRFLKQYDVPKQKGKPKADTPALVAEPEVADEEDTGSTPFLFYCNKITDRCKATHSEFAKMRTTKETKTFLGELVMEFIERFNPLIEDMTANMDNKTININSVKHVVKMLLIDGHKRQDTVSIEAGDIPDPAFEQAESEKRALARQNKTKYVAPTTVPTIKAYVVKRSITYENSRLDSIFSEFDKKYDIIKTHKDEEDEPDSPI
jgi:hypothetical protein